MTQHVVAVRRVLKQRPISYGSAAGVLHFDIRFRGRFRLYPLLLISAEPCEIHLKITGILIIVPSVLLGVLLGMAYGPTMRF